MGSTQRVVEKRGANHGLHLVLTILTCGIWAITGWPIAAAMGRKKVTHMPVQQQLPPPQQAYGYPPQQPYPQQYGQQPPPQYDAPPAGTPPYGYQQPPGQYPPQQ
ncbi:hypothetical protein [Streptomyces cylindrosporus]|uniref:Uncharacterized protein n=1 Tax=Streptomyces cylindrosporus TaxID=2927583 RepID=A0ABS9Y408_9ACTN|nr:hypothetical protein [Streptomyces cylindrosporus]MCI3271406.1 hypothetical protein [Streptomyces cylindrosporus]